MIELDFMVAPQVMVGKGAFGEGHPVDVNVTASPTVFPDHELYVTVQLTRPLSGRKVEILSEETRVKRDARSIELALVRLGVPVGSRLDRELQRQRRVLGKTR